MDEDDDQNQQATASQTQGEEGGTPPGLRPLETVAKGYQYYMNYLRGGGKSQISGVFGSADDILPKSALPVDQESKTPDNREHQQSLNQQPRESVQTPRSGIVTDQAFVEQGALISAVNLSSLDWTYAKANSRNPFETMETYDKRLEELNNKYHGLGILHEDFSIIGFVTDSNRQDLLLVINRKFLDTALALDPHSGDIVETFKIVLKNGKILLER